MNAYTRQDLSVMQAWPLERKIRVPQAKIIEWYHHYGGKVAVSFSGGKDSTVLLDLARRAFPDIPAVFVDTGLEYPEIREFVKTVPNVTWLRPEMPFSKVILEYGYPVISKDVARRIRYARKGGTWVLCHLNGLNRDGTPSKYNERYMKWRILLDAPFFVSDQCCFIMKERPLHRYNRETGRKQIIATMACERTPPERLSQNRMQRLSQAGPHLSAHVLLDGAGRIDLSQNDRHPVCLRLR